MGSDGVVGASIRKLKLPEKVSGDSIAVHPASVPRKLRSAIKKRGCESSIPLPDPKRLSHLVNGIEPLRKDCSKISKISMQRKGCLDHSPKRAALMSLSKEEEEVAETLSALAGLIPSNSVHVNDKMCCESLGAKASDLAAKNIDPTPVPEGSEFPKEEPNVACHPKSCEESNVIPLADGSSRESVQEKSLKEPPFLSCSKLSERRQLNLNLDVTVPPVHLSIPPLLRTCDQRSWINSSLSCASTEPSRESGLNEIRQEKALLPYSEAHIRIGAVDVDYHERQHGTLIERSDDGMSSRDLLGSGVDGLYLQPSSVMFPSWLSTPTSMSGLGAHEDFVSNDKVSCLVNGKQKTLKKCAAHVYISRLIQVFQISEGKSIPPSNASQLRPSQCVTDGPGPAEHLNDTRNETNGILSSSHTYGPGSYQNAIEASNSVPVNQRLHLGQQEEPSLSGSCGSKKQSFDFLSLSSGMGSAADNGTSMTGNKLEAGTNTRMHHLPTVGQHSNPVPFSMPWDCLSSSHRDQAAAMSGPSSAVPQVHLHMPPYYGNPYGPAHMSRTTKTAHQAQPKRQPLPQPQQIWTAQLAAQFRSGHLLSSHIANWQNGRHDLQSSAQSLQPLVPISQPSLDVPGAKYLHFSQQPLQLVALGPSVPPARAKVQHSQLPVICEDNGGRFCPDGVLPLQILCNEQR